MHNGTFAKNSIITEKGISLLLRILERAQSGSDAWALMVFASTEKSIVKGAENLTSLTRNAHEAKYPIIGPEGPNELFTHQNQLLIEDREKEDYASKLLAKKRKYAEEEIEKRKRRMVRRHAKPRKDWTPTDSSFEFADQMHSLWNVPPWSVTKSRLTPALSACRLKHDTDGELEYFMIERFFDELRARNETPGFETGEILWRRFIHYFPQLAKWAKLSAPTEEQLSRWDWYYEELSVRVNDLVHDPTSIDYEIERAQMAWLVEAKKMKLKPSDAEYVSRKKAIREQIENMPSNSINAIAPDTATGFFSND